MKDVLNNGYSLDYDVTMQVVMNFVHFVSKKIGACSLLGVDTYLFFVLIKSEIFKENWPKLGKKPAMRVFFTGFIKILRGKSYIAL